MRTLKALLLLYEAQKGSENTLIYIIIPTFPLSYIVKVAVNEVIKPRVIITVSLESFHYASPAFECVQYNLWFA